MKFRLALLLSIFAVLATAGACEAAILFARSTDGPTATTTSALAPTLGEAFSDLNQRCGEHCGAIEVQCSNPGWYATVNGDTRDSGLDVAGFACGFSSRQEALQAALSQCTARGGTCGGVPGAGGNCTSGYDDGSIRGRAPKGRKWSRDACR